MDHTRKVEVSNIPPNLSKDRLELIFEQKIYGGGQIDKIHLIAQSGIAFITFQTAEGRYIVFKTYQNTPALCELYSMTWFINNRVLRAQEHLHNDLCFA